MSTGGTGSTVAVDVSTGEVAVGVSLTEGDGDALLSGVFVAEGCGVGTAGTGTGLGEIEG